jgi:hypothetical protein
LKSFWVLWWSWKGLQAVNGLARTRQTVRRAYERLHVNAGSEKRYWFRLKRYGWGWGMPATWQGWVVLAVYTAGIAAGAVAFPPDNWMGTFVVHVIGLTILLVVVCKLTGEPARWRWGDSDDRGKGGKSG